MGTSIAEYSPTEAALAELATRYKGVLYEVSKPEGMKAARAARAEIKALRVALEKTRVEIKAPALKRVQEVDSEARRITAALSALEDPIDAQIAKEEDRRVAEKMAAQRAEQERLAAEERARKEAEEARMAAERAEIARRQAELDAADAARRQAEEESRRKIEEQERAARARIEEEERAARAVREEADKVAQALRNVEEAKARAAEEHARKVREESERQERLAQQARDEVARVKALQLAEVQDASAMLETFVKRFGHRPEFKPLVVWINKYLSQRKAA